MNFFLLIPNSLALYLTKMGKRAELGERPTSDFPKHTLEVALRIPNVIEQTNGGRPLPPPEIAIGLGLSPGSSDYRVQVSSASKYGVTAGSYKQERIALTPLGSRIVAPTSEQDRQDAIVEAALHNRTFRQMFEHFKGKKLPDDSFFENVVVREFGVPREHAPKCVKVFRATIEFAGLLRKATTGLWLASHSIPEVSADREDSADDSSETNGDAEGVRADNEPVASRTFSTKTNVESPVQAPIRVFISHSKNMEIVGQIKTMLNVAEVPFEIAVEQESTAIPVPEKVFAAMRNCTAAVICVTADEGAAHSNSQISQNVLIEIGAAFVLYDKRVILVWDKRIPIPSNLQGLYRCEFEGSELSWSKGMKLMEAIKQFKTLK